METRSTNDHESTRDRRSTPQRAKTCSTDVGKSEVLFTLNKSERDFASTDKYTSTAIPPFSDVDFFSAFV